MTKSLSKMPGKGAKEKTYTTLSEVGNVLDDLLQKFATFTTNQDRIIDQNMSSKMEELTAFQNAAFQKLENKLDSLKSEIYEGVMKRTEEQITPLINKLETENMELKERVENLEKVQMRVDNLEKFQTFNINKEHMRKLLISSEKFKQKDGKSIENIIKEYLPEIQARYTSRWIGDFIVLNFPTIFDKQAFTKAYYASNQKEKKKGIYLSDYIPPKYSYEQNRMKRVASAMKKAGLITGYRVDFQPSGPSLVIANKTGDKTTYLRSSDSPDSVNVTSFPTIKIPKDFSLLLPSREQYEEEKNKKLNHKRNRSGSGSGSAQDLNLLPSKVGRIQA